MVSISRSNGSGRWIVSPNAHTDGERIADGQAGAGNVCAGGVETDEYAAPVAYYLLKTSPDSFGGGVIAGRRPEDTVRLPAWGQRSELPTVVHVMAKRRGI